MRNIKKILYALLFVVVLTLPFIAANTYQVYMLDRALIHILVASGLVFLTGFAGQISLGQAGFYCLGAYTTGLLTSSTRLGLPIPVGIIAAVLICMLAGLLLSFPSFKLKAFFLSLTTIAFGQIIWNLALNLIDLTGGPGGLFNIPLMRLGNVALGNEGYYYFLLGFVALVILIMYRIKHSHLGRQLFAVNDDEAAAETCGINSRRMKSFAFVFSAALAGLAGAFFAHLVGFLTPEPFTSPMESANFMAMAIVGGLRMLTGGITGGVILTFLPEIMRINKEGFENFYLIFNSLIIIIIVIFLPLGLGDIMRRVFGRIWKNKSETLTLPRELRKRKRN